MTDNVITVTQLNMYIKQLVAADRYLARVAVSGELSNFKLHSSGHIYCSLKDDGGVIRAVMFRSAAQKLQFRPDNGMKVIALGRVAVYERDGQYQLYIDSMQPDGVGALYKAYEQLKARLQEEGLFAPERKRPIPRIPRRIGIVTAPTGAAVRDMINIITRRFPHTHIILYPTLVQGSDAPPSICRAIRWFDDNKAADVIIVGRGGGSIEDLWAFNDEGVARTIAACAIPVISAVGHETDFTIADFAADLRAPTPSAAAELAVPDMADIEHFLLSSRDRLINAVASYMEYRRANVNSLAESRVMVSPRTMFDERRMAVMHCEKNAQSAVKLELNKRRTAFSAAAAKLDALSPLSTLSRGYAIVSDEGGRTVISAASVKRGDRVTVSFSDGRAGCTVEEVETGGGMNEKD